MRTLRERLDAGLRVLGMSQAAFCRQAGLPATNYLTRIASGDLRGRHHLATIASRLDCTLPWLLSGTGEPPAWALPAPGTAPGPKNESRLAALEQRVLALERQFAALSRLPADQVQRRAALARAVRRLADVIVKN